MEISSTTRSSRLFYFAVAVIFSLFVWRLFDLQVVNSSQYKTLALEEHQRKFEIKPERGRILLRDGDAETPLVLNEIRPTLFADPSGIEDPEQVAEELTELVGGKVGDYKDLLALEDSVYVVLKKKLTAKQADKVREAAIAGVGLQDVPYRVYPERNLASQVVGFVNDDGEGQYGVEAALQDELSGKTGTLKATTDVNGIPLTSSDDSVEVPAEDGQDVTLTIDRNIQATVEKMLEKGVKGSKSKSGSAVVMDPNSGAILAMANYPSYDPAKYTQVKAEDYGIFNNDVVSLPYETGSGVKVFTMAAGLSEGKVNKNTTYYDPGYVQVDDRRIENAGNKGGLERNMLEVVQHSINTGVVFVLKQLGGGSINKVARTTLHDYFTNKFGFGSTTGIAQTNEAAGSIASPESALDGNNVRYANMSFGQGMTVTMLQMAAAFSSVVNGGDYFKPYLVHKADDVVSEPQIIRSGVVSESISKDLIEMTRAVVDDGGGYTAKRPGYFVGGKTGTAQVLEADGTYSDTRQIGSFVGFVGSKSPEFVIMTRVDEPVVERYAGSEAATPIFADISNWLIKHYDIPPGN